MAEATEEATTDSWRDIVSILFVAYLTPVAAIPVWLISRWSNATKWVVTAVSIISLVLLYYASYGGYKFAKFRNDYTPVLEVQQALDVYGLQKGQYPSKLDELKPDFIKQIPSVSGLEYKQEEDGKNYVLQATVDGKNVVLGPVLKAK
jgi:hypothetical protein